MPFALVLVMELGRSASVWGVDLGPLLRSAQTDPAYKVRLQAIRLIDRWLGRKPELAGNALMTVRAVATHDPEPLVRALAATVMGRRGGAEELAWLMTITRREDDKLVRDAVTRAVSTLEHRLATPRGLLVWEVDPISSRSMESGPEQAPHGHPDRIRLATSLLQDALHRVAGSRFEVVAVSQASEQSGAVGTWIRSTVVGPHTSESGHIELVIKTAVGTWPQRNLRQVLTTRARLPVASSTENDQVHPKYVRRLLEAAAAQAADEVVRYAGGGP